MDKQSQLDQAFVDGFAKKAAELGYEPGELENNFSYYSDGTQPGQTLDNNLNPLDPDRYNPAQRAASERKAMAQRPTTDPRRVAPAVRPTVNAPNLSGAQPTRTKQPPKTNKVPKKPGGKSLSKSKLGPTKPVATPTPGPVTQQGRGGPDNPALADMAARLRAASRSSGRNNGQRSPAAKLPGPPKASPRDMVEQRSPWRIPGGLQQPSAIMKWMEAQLGNRSR